MEREQRYVGIDFHRRRSVIVHKNAAGEIVETVHIDNDPVTFARELEKAGERPEVVLEACYGWYWLADLLEEMGASVHLAHPLGNAWGNRRVKNDERDANDLVDLLRLGRLAEAYIAPPELRELREIVRYRAKLVTLRSGLKSQVHSVLAKEGIPVPMSDLFGTAGQDLLNTAKLGRAYGIRTESLRDLIGDFDKEIAMLDKEVDHFLSGDVGYLAIQALPGVGPVLGAVFLAEIGDVHRFSSPDKLCCWAGLTPRHRESDLHVVRGSITKQGSRLVRWAAVEAASRQRGVQGARYEAIVARRDSKKIARVALARHLLTLVYYGLRDGEIRCLAKAG
ncbi:MAG TPA: IS110 family transposase [Acidimicrobiales bacterium]